MVQTLLTAIVLVGCTFTPSPTSTLTNVDAPTGTTASNPMNTATPTCSVSPTAAATDLYSRVKIPESIVVNIDGFACAAAMAFNIQQSLYQDEGSNHEVWWEDLSVPLHSTSTQFETAPDWYIYNLALYIREFDLPISIYLEPWLKNDDLLENLETKKISIAVVQTECCLHAVVIVAYDPSRGYLFLDSLQDFDDGLPDEKDFEDFTAFLSRMPGNTLL